MPVQCRATSGQFTTRRRDKSIPRRSSYDAPHQHQHAITPGEPVITVATRHKHITNVNRISFSRNSEVPTVADGGDASENSEVDSDGPPSKRRRLSIAAASTTAPAKRTQTTLDTLWKSTQLPRSPKPPNRLIRQEPHGQVAQTLNGVRTTLDADEDELLRPSPKPERHARRTTRSPQPASRTASTSQPAQKKDDKRSLRSADDGPRLKSELATYFPNYEDVIFDAPQEEEFLTADTTLYISDDTVKPSMAATPSPTKSARHGRNRLVNGTSDPPWTPRHSHSSHLNGSPSLNLDFVVNNISNGTEDPLSEDHFLKSHKRAERKEKQLRNIEKERAMHEKVQLDRLLDGLQGHDWLKVLGITGVTDGEAKKYEPKRDYFIAEVQALVDKFKQWRDQEKKQRMQKEAAAAREAEEVDEEEDCESTEGSIEPPSSDLNASAARQLQQETITALKKSSSVTSLKGKGKGKEKEKATTSLPSLSATFVTAPPKLSLSSAPIEPPSPISSFYAKRHLRDAALSKTRSHGRNTTAFGQPIPEMEEREFELPEDYVSENVLRANARERRRRKRESAINAKEKSLLS